MMMGLFSVFDPVSFFGIHLNWLGMLLGLVFIPGMYWLLPSGYMMVFLEGSSFLRGEFGAIVSLKLSGSLFFLCSLFIFIVFSNFLGLFPFVFTCTSHLLVTLGLALPIWVSLMLYGWVNKMLVMLAHLVPVGTPGALMVFMVLIETVSNLIRPITLSVRLAANMIAGHLLIVLLGSAITWDVFVLFFGTFMLVLLLLLELAVAFIQGYVFTMLSGLYLSEI